MQHPYSRMRWANPDHLQVLQEELVDAELREELVDVDSQVKEVRREASVD